MSSSESSFEALLESMRQLAYGGIEDKSSDSALNQAGRTNSSLPEDNVREALELSRLLQKAMASIALQKETHLVQIMQEQMAQLISRELCRWMDQHLTIIIERCVKEHLFQTHVAKMRPKSSPSNEGTLS